MYKTAMLIITLAIIVAVAIFLNKTRGGERSPANTCANGYCQGPDFSKKS